MNCDDIRDLLPAYVLGVATPEEAKAVTEHLAGCGNHGDIAVDRAAAVVLGAAAGETPPPAGLKTRIMATAEARAGKPSAEGAVPAPPDGGGIVRTLPRWMRHGYPAAAVLALAVGVLIVWNVMLQASSPPEKFVHYYWGNEGDWMRIETVLEQSGAEVSLGGLGRLGPAERYQLWTTRGGSVLPVGAFNTSPEGQWSGEFDFAFSEGDRVWITIEPAAGSPQPTGEAVLRSRF